MRKGRQPTNEPTIFCTPEKVQAPRPENCCVGRCVSGARVSRGVETLLAISTFAEATAVAGILIFGRTFISTSANGSKCLVGCGPSKCAVDARNTGSPTDEHNCIRIVCNGMGVTASHLLRDNEAGSLAVRVRPLVAKHELLVGACHKSFGTLANAE